MANDSCAGYSFHDFIGVEIAIGIEIEYRWLLSGDGVSNHCDSDPDPDLDYSHKTVTTSEL